MGVSTSTFSQQIKIKASKQTVWNVLADIGAICRWNPGVIDSRTTTTGEIGLGSGRRCELGGKSYLDEEVVEWKPSEALTVRVVSTNLPFKTADIRFTLHEERENETTVTVSPSYQLKFGLLGDLLDLVFARSRYRKGMASLLAGLKRHVEAGP